MHKLLLVVVLGTASSAIAATIELESFNYEKCLHWHMTSDVGGAESEAYRVALTRVKPGHNVYSASALVGSGGIEKFGVCSYLVDPKKSIFQCLPNQDYPFAGAVYKSSRSQPYRYVTLLRCKAGCTRETPQVIFDINADIPDDPKRFDAERERRWSKFQRMCRKK